MTLTTGSNDWQSTSDEAKVIFGTQLLAKEDDVRLENPTTSLAVRNAVVFDKQRQNRVR